MAVQGTVQAATQLSPSSIDAAATVYCSNARASAAGRLPAGAPTRGARSSGYSLSYSRLPCIRV